jgi:hypothetical protein
MASVNSFADNPIRVSVPASVAFNPKSFKVSVAALMERLGCGKCFSGFDCRFQLQRDYLVDPADMKKLTELPAQVSNHNVVSLALNKTNGFDILQVNKIIDSLHKRFGCAPCHSGYDFQFRNEIEQVINV